MTLPTIRREIAGVGPRVNTVERHVWWGSETVIIQAHYSQGVIIGSAARDTGHTGNETLLRAGLAMAYDDTNKVWLPYDSAGVGVTDTVLGVLRNNEQMASGTAGGVIDRHGATIYIPGAHIKTASLITNDAGGVGPVKTALIALGFVFDDWYE